MKRIELEIIGITYNQIESGVYAVILKEKKGNRRLPIVIGYPEAQAIECKLQEIVTPRPLTHDLLMDIVGKFDIEIKEIVIRRLNSGVFVADILCQCGDKSFFVDSRSSDALAVALRAKAPVYTFESVMTEASFDPESQDESELQEKNQSDVPEIKVRKVRKTIKQLEQEMMKAAEEEKYEEAAKIKAEIEKRRRRGKQNKS